MRERLKPESDGISSDRFWMLIARLTARVPLTPAGTSETNARSSLSNPGGPLSDLRDLTLNDSVLQSGISLADFHLERQGNQEVKRNRFRSALDRAGGNALHDAAPEEHVQDQDRQQRRHDEADIRRVGAVERLRRDGEGVELLLGQHQVREQIVVPIRHRVDDGNGGDRRLEQREDYLPVASLRFIIITFTLSPPFFARVTMRNSPSNR